MTSGHLLLPSLHFAGKRNVWSPQSLRGTEDKTHGLHRLICIIQASHTRRQWSSPSTLHLEPSHQEANLLARGERAWSAQVEIHEVPIGSHYAPSLTWSTLRYIHVKCFSVLRCSCDVLKVASFYSESVPWNSWTLTSLDGAMLLRSGRGGLGCLWAIGVVCWNTQACQARHRHSQHLHWKGDGDRFTNMGKLLGFHVSNVDHWAYMG